MAATIFNGSVVRALKRGLKLNDRATIFSDNIDPSSSGFAAAQGDIFISTLTKNIYVKTGAGDTAWTLSATLASLPSGRVVITDLSGNLTTDAELLYDSSTNTLTVSNIDNSGTLTLGANSTNINIGNAGATITITGAVESEQVTNLEVKDKLIVINDGGAVGSGGSAGLDIEENALITGYNKTSADRNSWTLKAPNTAGDATITPGAGGITLNQSSHDPVTLAAVGSTPNANAASISGQVVNLEPADPSFPGVVTTAAQSFSGRKTVDNGITVGDTILPSSSGIIDIGEQANEFNTIFVNDLSFPGDGTIETLGTVDSGLLDIFTGEGSATSGTINISSGDSLVSGNLNLSTGVADDTQSGNINIISGDNNGTGATGDISITTGNSTASSSGNIFINVGTAGTTRGEFIIDSGRFELNVEGSITIDPTTLISVSNKPITDVQDPTDPQDAATKNYVDNAISGSFSPGDISETSFSLANNQVVAANVTGLLFNNAVVRSAEVHYSIFIDATSDLYEMGKLHAIQRGSDWVFSQSSIGDVSGVVFSLTTAGQFQYTDNNYAGFSSGTMKFRAITTSV